MVLPKAWEDIHIWSFLKCILIFLLPWPLPSFPGYHPPFPGTTRALRSPPRACDLNQLSTAPFWFVSSLGISAKLLPWDLYTLPLCFLFPGRPSPGPLLFTFLLALARPSLQGPQASAAQGRCFHCWFLSPEWALTATGSSSRSQPPLLKLADIPCVLGPLYKLGNC